MSEIILILEVLKFLFFAFGVTRYFLHRKREKALLAELENHKQRLTKLENAEKSKKLDDWQTLGNFNKNYLKCNKDFLVYSCLYQNFSCSYPKLSKHTHKHLD